VPYGDLQQVKRVNRVEFFIYYTLIFTLAVLPHVLGWLFQTLRHGKFRHFPSSVTELLSFLFR